MLALCGLAPQRTRDEYIPLFSASAPATDTPVRSPVCHTIIAPLNGTCIEGALGLCASVSMQLMFSAFLQRPISCIAVEVCGAVMQLLRNKSETC